MNDIKKAIEQLDWYFQADDGCAAEDITKTAYQTLKEALKAQEPSVMMLGVSETEWKDKVLWLEIRGKYPTPCLFREFLDKMMFGNHERIMYFDIVGSSSESGYMVKNYRVKWRCWTSRPTDAQREAIPWN